MNGELAQVSTREAQHHFAKVLSLLDEEGEVMITRRGEPVATLKKYQQPAENQSVKMPDFGRLREEIFPAGSAVYGHQENEVLVQRDSCR